MKMELDTDLKAEAYFVTSFGEIMAGYDGFFLSSEGKQKRGNFHEVLGIKEFRGLKGTKVVDFVGLEVSRNGIYHLLPEFLFIPFTLGNTASNTFEIVEEIRKNRQREADAKKFFAPFDTELFLWKVALLEGQLGWPNQTKGETIPQIAFSLAGKSPDLDPSVIGLFLESLIEGESIKDRPEAIEKLLSQLLRRRVIIREEIRALPDIISIPLGEAVMAVDSILSGKVLSEFPDWIVEIELDQNEVEEEIKGSRIETLVNDILGFFCLAQRAIVMDFKVKASEKAVPLADCVLGMTAILE